MAREFHGKVFVYQMVAFPSELQQLHGIRLFDEQSPGGRRGNGAGRRQGRADDDGTGAGGEENHLGSTAKSTANLEDSPRDSHDEKNF